MEMGDPEVKDQQEMFQESRRCSRQHPQRQPKGRGISAVVSIILSPRKGLRTNCTSAMKHKRSNAEPTQEEIQWALAIKQAALDHADTAEAAANMTDLEFLQHGIIAKDSIDKALVRIKRLQAFKERYGIQGDGSYDNGFRDILAFIQSFPAFLTGLGVATDGAQVVCYDFSQYRVRSIHTDEAYAVCMRAFFYTLQAAQCNIDAIRSGVRLLGDFEGLGWENFSVNAEKRAAELYNNCYPMRVTEMALMQANPLIRVFYSILKVFISKKLARVFTMPSRRKEFLNAHKSLYPAEALPEAWGGKQTGAIVGELFGKKLKERYDTASRIKL